MLNESDLKVGTLIWWVAERYISAWDCPGVITEVNLETRKFSVQTFDTFGTSGALSIPADFALLGTDRRIESCVTEMRIATPKEVRRYLKSHVRSLEEMIVTRQHKVEDAQDELASYNEQCAMIEKTFLS